jgi:predicted ATPase/DNA-binding SARP family transcriptional activator
LAALAPDQAPLQLQFFGPFAAQVHGQPLAPLRTRKGAWLLALLALRAGQKIERDWLAGVLWPDSQERQALANLRTSLKDLRQALETEAWRLSAPTTRTLSLDLTGAAVDVLAFDAAIARGDPASLEAAAALYHGPLLEGCAEEWAFQERQIREQAQMGALETLAARAQSAGDQAQAEGHLRRVVAADPLRETAQRRLMQVLATRGNYAGAVRVYRDLRLRLHREVNSEPDPETTALFQQLRAVARGQAVAPSPEWRRSASSGSAPGASLSPSAPDAPEEVDDFPALPRLSDFPHNLPLQLTRFIGRERELAAVKDLLATHRLVTLTGVGGGGKTRLALQVAADRLSSFTDGVWLVELAPVRDPALVLPAVVAVFGVREEQSRTLLATLTEFLRGKNLLLVLDNCEQVLEAAPQVRELLAGAPQVTVLATSRAPLRLQGEQEYPVPPLDIPDPKHLPPLELLSQYAAVELFCQRARDVQPDFALTRENAGAVAAICQRLDGLPLAIILAAARMKLFSPQALLARLESRLPLLSGAAQDRPARHQTLRGAIAWSYDLLTEQEQLLFRRLSVFVGGCSLAAAEAVGEDLGHVLDGMAALINQSLLRQEEQEDGEPRFMMLETIREFGLERLAESGGAELTRQRHRDYFLGLAEQAEPELKGSGQEKWLTRLEEEHDNLRAALDWCREHGDGEAGLRLGGALWQFWEVRGYLTEGRERLTQLLALPGAEARTVVRGRALNGVGRLSHRQGDHQAARALHEESLTLHRELADQQGVAQSLGALGNVARYHGDYEEARALLAASLTIFRDLGDQQGVAWSLYNLGCMSLNQGEYQKARELFAEGLDLFRELGHHRGICHSVGVLGIVARIQGDYTVARALGEESLAIGRELGDYIFNGLGSLGSVALAQGDYETARVLLQEGLTLSRNLGNYGDTVSALSDLGHVAREAEEYTLCAAHYRESMALRQSHDDRWGIARALEDFAGLAGRQGQWERAARLLGAAEAVDRSLGQNRPVVIIARVAVPGEYERTLDGARAALSEAAFAAAWAEGQAMPLEEAITDALEEADNAQLPAH